VSGRPTGIGKRRKGEGLYQVVRVRNSCDKKNVVVRRRVDGSFDLKACNDNEAGGFQDRTPARGTEGQKKTNGIERGDHHVIYVKKSKEPAVRNRLT